MLPHQPMRYSQDRKARKMMGREVADVQIVIDLISARKANLTSQWEARAELAYVLGSLQALLKWAKRREEKK